MRPGLRSGPRATPDATEAKIGNAVPPAVVAAEPVDAPAEDSVMQAVPDDAVMRAIACLGRPAPLVTVTDMARLLGLANLAICSGPVSDWLRDLAARLSGDGLEVRP